MELLQQVWQVVLAPQSGCGPICQPWQDLMQQGWDLIPVKGETADKLSLLFTIIGGLGGLSFFYWLWQKWKKTDTDSMVKQLDSKVERQSEIIRVLVEQSRAKTAALPGGDQPGAKQAEVFIEQDIGAAISTLAKAGKIEAAQAAELGDTKAADAALAAKIAKIERARTSASKEEAELYRQRGALAYLHDTDAALRFYAKAADLDPENARGAVFPGAVAKTGGQSPCRQAKLRAPDRAWKPDRG